MQLQKEQQTDNKLKIKENLPENALEAVKSYFGRCTIVDCTFVEFDCTFVEHR